MSRIAETYIHLRVQASYEEMSVVKRYFEVNGALLSKEIFGGRLEIEVKLEEASLKVWVTIAGLVYGIIAGYGSFRTGIDYTIKDSRAFSERLSSSFVKDALIPKEKVYRIERRLGVPGKISRLLDRLKRLETRSKNTAINKEIEYIQKEIINILKRLDNEQDRKLFIKNLPDYAKERLPSKFPAAKEWPEEIPVAITKQIPSSRRRSDGTLSYFVGRYPEYSTARDNKNRTRLGLSK